MPLLDHIQELREAIYDTAYWVTTCPKGHRYKIPLRLWHEWREAGGGDTLPTCPGAELSDG